MAMTKYQRLEESYTSPEEEPEADGSFVRKRKRLESPDSQVAPQSSSTNQYDVQQTAWIWSGIIGVMMTIGSIISTLANPETSPIMAIPFFYMVAVMYFLGNRRD
jgi:hypothetical protein